MVVRRAVTGARGRPFRAKIQTKWSSMRCESLTLSLDRWKHHDTHMPVDGPHSTTTTQHTTPRHWTEKSSTRYGIYGKSLRWISVTPHALQACCTAPRIASEDTRSTQPRDTTAWTHWLTRICVASPIPTPPSPDYGIKLGGEIYCPSLIALRWHAFIISHVFYGGWTRARILANNAYPVS